MVFWLLKIFLIIRICPFPFLNIRLSGLPNAKKDGIALSTKLIQPLLKQLNEDKFDASWVSKTSWTVFLESIKLILLTACGMVACLCFRVLTSLAACAGRSYFSVVQYFRYFPIFHSTALWWCKFFVSVMIFYFFLYNIKLLLRLAN